ncbi:MAG: hypothetical protein KC910_27980 [Candidatus Eremiobacteraeota bacterium]|nr:hypothetical protein [Candidatus Eremiobacteraeota bacterium]
MHILPFQGTLAQRRPGKARAGEVFERIESGFDGWDRNGDGKLSWSEMRRAVADPANQGRQAAALGTLYALMEAEQDGRGHPAFERDRLEDLAEEADPGYDDAYRLLLGKIEGSAHQLYTSELPDAFSIQQGVSPSCAFLSAMFGQARRDPALLREAITELPDGRLGVKFAGLDKTIKIAPPTDTELALYSGSGQDGYWLTCFEKAWGVHHGGRRLGAFEHSDAWPEDAIEAITGGQAGTARVPRHPTLEKGEVPAFLRPVQRELASNHIAIAWTNFEEVEQPGLVTGHAYALVGYDEDRGTVELRNPYGHGEPSDANGRALDGRDDGLFKLSLEQFSENFVKLAYQTD